MEAKLKFFEKDDNKDFRLAQKLALGESEVNHIIRVRNQLVIAAEKYGREQLLSPTQIKTISENMHEQLQLAQRLVDFVDSPNTKICVTRLRRKVKNSKSAYAQVQLFQERKCETNFNKLVL